MKPKEPSLREPKAKLLTPSGELHDLPSEDRSHESILWPKDGGAGQGGAARSQRLYRRHELFEGKVYLFLEDSEALAQVPHDVLERLRAGE